MTDIRARERVRAVRGVCETTDCEKLQTTHGRYSDGTQKYSRFCARHNKLGPDDQYREGRRSQKQRAKQRRAQAAREIIADRKKEHGPCERCGYDADSRALTFHHRDSDTKLFNIGDAAKGWVTLERLVVELEKCAVLCANCHLIVEDEVRKTCVGEEVDVGGGDGRSG